MMKFTVGQLVKYEDHTGNLIEGEIQLGEYFYRTALEETRHFGYYIKNKNVTTTDRLKLSYQKLQFANGAVPTEWQKVSELRPVVSVLDYDLIEENTN